MRLKIWVLAFFVVVLSAPSGFAEAMDKYWDFENGLDGWSAWGLPGGNDTGSHQPDCQHQPGTAASGKAVPDGQR